MTAYNN